jgi:hypothetical protein
MGKYKNSHAKYAEAQKTLKLTMKTTRGLWMSFGFARPTIHGYMDNK